jgi:L-lactate dehydrogenase complex protein LldG
MTTAREEILRRVRTALAGAPAADRPQAPAAPGSPGAGAGTTAGTNARTNAAAGPAARPAARPAAGPAANPAPDAPAIPRDYLDAHGDLTPRQLTDLLAENLADYRARVHRADDAHLPALVARLLTEHGSSTVLTPDGLPAAWTSALDGSGVRAVAPEAGQTAADLDAVDSVLTTCTLAVAETGSIVLNAGPGQGQRRHTLIPDHHVCVIRTPDQVVASVPRALPLLDPARPTTWISGPSATSDIELDRVEGVHGPRTLDVVLLHEPEDASEAAGAA